jgi:V8-like Glu-specific endopeptidase
LSQKILSCVVGLTVVAGCALAPAALGAPATHVKLKPGGVQAFWTPKRMQRAVPLDGSSHAPPGDAAARANPPVYVSEAVPNRHSQPFPAVGKVFFKIDGGIYVCSASITDSPGRSLVWTAGHCVRDAGRRGKFATKWVFVPGYDHGSAPYGRWPAKVLWSNAGWVDNNQHYDYSAAILKSKNGQRVQDAVGSSLPMDVNPDYDQTWQAIGYPEANIWGQNLWHCVSGFFRSDKFGGGGPDPVGIGCNMTGGSSGGPWLTEDGSLGAVTSYGYRKQPDALYGTYLGTKAGKLYSKLRKKH